MFEFEVVYVVIQWEEEMQEAQGQVLLLHTSRFSVHLNMSGI